MFSLLFIIFLVASVAFAELALKHPTSYRCDTNKYSVVSAIFGVIAGILLISIFALGIKFGYARVVDNKIAMYTEENSKIEVEISDIVNDYKEYEADIIKDCSGKSPITLIQLYPDLKSDSLVKSQIKLYKENNQKIKDLKLEKINYNVIKWFLYFGGSKGYMYSFKIIILLLVSISTISISIDLLSESKELEQGKINLMYVAIALMTSVVALLFLAFLIMFIKYVWVWYVP